jgi:hypothetical protein
VDSIITVGRGSGFPVRKIIDQLNRRKSNTILLFPEGSVSSGFSETRPLREKFAHGLLADLQAQGIKTVVIPVTFENSARFVFDSSISSLFSKLSKGAQPTELSVQVHDPIDQTTMNIVKAATNEATAVNRLIRSFWLEQLPTDQNHLMGTLRPQKALQTFEEQTGKSLTPAINKCGKVHSLVSP